jgi:cyclomaltodextrinase
MSDDKLATKPDIRLGRYRHYKGNEYRVVDIACQSETLEWYVVYQPLYEHGNMPNTWIRPAAMFVETVDVDGASMPRFTYIDK